MGKIDHSLPDRRQRVASMKGLVSGPGGPHDPGMEQRVAKLESDVGEIKDILKRLEPVLSRVDASARKLELDVSELKGKAAHIPSLWQIAGTMLAINAGIVAVSGLIITLLRHSG